MTNSVNGLSYPWEYFGDQNNSISHCFPNIITFCNWVTVSDKHDKCSWKDHISRFICIRLPQTNWDIYFKTAVFIRVSYLRTFIEAFNANLMALFTVCVSFCLTVDYVRQTLQHTHTNTTSIQRGQMMWRIAMFNLSLDLKYCTYTAL